MHQPYHCRTSRKKILGSRKIKINRKKETIHTVKFEKNERKSFAFFRE